MTSRVAISAVSFLLLAMPAFAQTIGPVVTSDLNGDGKPERFTLVDSDGSVDLQIEAAGGRVVIAQDIAWLGGSGQEPELTLAPNGSVRLTSMNESVGRGRWHQTLTIAYRNGAYMVAGYTYDWYDTLDMNNNGNCDINLLNGKGNLIKNGSSAAPISSKMRALPVTDWKDDISPPPECQAD